MHTVTTIVYFPPITLKVLGGTKYHIPSYCVYTIAWILNFLVFRNLGLLTTLNTEHTVRKNVASGGLLETTTSDLFVLI